VRLEDLALLVLDELGAHPVHDARQPVADRRPAGGLDADERSPRLGEAGEGARRVRATPDAGDDEIGIAPEQRTALFARLVADDALELPHHPGKGVRATTGRCSECVLSTLATQSRSASLIASFSVFEPEETGRTFGAEEAHAKDVELLADDVHSPM